MAAKAQHTLHILIGGVKVSFPAYWFEQKYAGSRYPDMLIPLSWQQVTQYFSVEAPRLL